MPDQFEFLSLNAFKKLTSNERQAYLERVARHVGALKADLDAPIRANRQEQPHSFPEHKLDRAVAVRVNTYNETETLTRT